MSKKNKETSNEVKKDIVSNDKIIVMLEKSKEWITDNYRSIVLFTIGLAIGITVMFAIGYGNIAQLEDGKELVVSVEGKNITADDIYLDLRSKYGMAQIITTIDEFILKDKYSDLRSEAVDFADNYIGSLKSSYTENWADFLAYYGFKNDGELKENLILQYYSDQSTIDYVKETLTKKQVDDYYKNEIAGDIKVSHILIKTNYPTDATDDEIISAENKAKEEAQKVLNELKKSDKPLEVFGELAKKYSEDSANADKGGDLGYFNKGVMEDTFEKAAFKLAKVGDYTAEPVQTSYGYHIIIKTDKDKDKAPLEEVENDIRLQLANQKIEMDSTLKIKAIMDLRNKYELTFQEPSMKKEYDDLMNKNIAEAIENDKLKG